MSIYDVIKDDHRKVEKLFDELKGISDPDLRYDCFDRLKEELLAHSKAEEKVFYQPLKKGETKEQVGHSKEEHDDIVALLAQIQDLDPSDKNFMKKVEDCRQAVEHHVQEEESDLMPKARKIIGDDKDNTLARQFQTEKGRLQESGLEPTG